MRKTGKQEEKNTGRRRHLSMVARLLLFLVSWLPYSVCFCFTSKNRFLRARLVEETAYFVRGS
jgi:hypothetical protein